MNKRADSDADLPSFELCTAQAGWLRGARSRLLRRANIERRKVIVEVGAGWGNVANELCQRTGRRVVAVDRRARPNRATLHEHIDWVVARAEQLPLADASVDLIFAQMTFLWLDAPLAVAEAARVLTPGGVLAVIEPDFGGLMEYPNEIATKDLWNDALCRAGADPCVGRKLPGLFVEAGLRVETRFPDRYELADVARMNLLTELELTNDERHQVERIRSQLSSNTRPHVAHLPLWMVLGEKPAVSG